MKNITHTMVALVLSAGILVPSVSFAQAPLPPEREPGPSTEIPANDPRNSVDRPANDRTCVVSDAARERVMGNIERIRERIAFRKNQLGVGRENRREEIQERVDNARDRWMEVRDAALERILDARPFPEELRDDVEKFRNDTNAARAERDAAFDAAKAEFQANVDLIRVTLTDEVLTSIDTFATEVQAAFVAAQDRCERGVDNETNRTQFSTELTAARAKFAKARENYDIKVTLEQNQIDLRQTLEEVKVTFLTRMRDAQTELENAWRLWQAAGEPLQGVENLEPANTNQVPANEQNPVNEELPVNQ